MITIGITGTIGAGKGAIVDYLKTKGFEHFSARIVLLKEIEKRKLPPTRDSMLLIANEWRNTYSPSFIMEQLLKMREKTEQNAVLESIRAMGEISYLKEQIKKFYVIAVDADPKLRYERIYARKSSTDNISFEKFTEDEYKEMQNTEPWKTNLYSCMEKADFTIKNNGTFKELQTQIDTILSQILA